MEIKTRCLLFEFIDPATQAIDVSYTLLENMSIESFKKDRDEQGHVAAFGTFWSTGYGGFDIISACHAKLDWMLLVPCGISWSGALISLLSSDATKTRHGSWKDSAKSSSKANAPFTGQAKQERL